MGSMLEIVVRIRKFVIISMRTCSRSVCYHPFLVGILLLLVLLYRSFPFAFSLLVIASPVFVCSAALLGTLLILGQPNRPEVEKELKTSHDIASLRSGVSGDGTVVSERDGCFGIESFSGTTRDVVDISEASSRVLSEADDNDGSVAYVPLVDDNLPQNQSERVLEDVERELDNKKLESQGNIHEEKLGIEGMPSYVEAIGKQFSLAQKGDHLESSLGGGGGDNGADDDEASDCGSDQLEGSSPDASMADILPILDELHPLLDLDAPQPAHMSYDESDAASDRSVGGSAESDEDVENRDEEVEEGGVDDNDSDEEEAQGGKGDERKSVIKWTEDDQKNFMDLGNLELERNQCLENLIARRRASKRFSLKADKNLIDFDSSDNPFTVTPLLVTRHNPFDVPDDSYDKGLQPIPGSAPTILVPRRNPFDLPYEPNEEKPDFKGDHFGQEFMAFPPKDAFFCRDESFSLGPSGLGDAKQESQYFNLRPVFVPERLASEGTNYSPLQKQSSHVGDSKLSSILETESVSSSEDLDERKFSEQEFTKGEVISNIYHASDLVDHGSQSSEDVDPLEMEQGGKRDVQHVELGIKLGKVENLEPSLSGTGGLATPVEHSTNEIHLKAEPFEEDNSSRLSLSSLSEVDEKISDVRKGGSTSLEPRGDLILGFVPPLEESQVQFMSGMVDDNQHKEPVYDQSPTSSEKVLSFNSISSDMQAAISEMVTPPASAEMYVPFTDQDSDLHGERIENGTSGYEEIRGATSKVHAADEIGKGSNSEVDVDRKNLDVKAASSDSSYQYVPSKEKHASEQEKGSDKSMGEPHFDDHNGPNEPAIIILSESKEDSSISKDMNVLEVREVQVPSLTDMSSVTSKSTSSKEIGSGSVQETITTHATLKQVSVGSVGELPKPSNSNDGSTEVGTNAVGSIEKIASGNIGTGVQEAITTTLTDFQQVSEGNGGEMSKPSSSKDELEKVGTNSVSSTMETAPSKSSVQETIPTHPTLKQVSEGNVGEMSKPSSSKDESEKVETSAVSSTKEIEPSGSCVQETTPTNTALKEVSKDNVDDMLKPTKSEDESAEVGTNAVGSTKEIAPSGSNVQETIPNHTVGSTKEIAPSGSNVQETIPNHTALQQVSKGNVEIPKESNSKEESAKIGTNAVDSTKEYAPSGSSVQETMSTHTTLK